MNRTEICVQELLLAGCKKYGLPKPEYIRIMRPKVNDRKGSAVEARPAKRRSGEADHQKFVFDVLELNERKYPFLKWIYAIPNGGHRHPAVAGQLKAQGVKKGISDICIPIPKDKYHGAYIEMKYGKNNIKHHA
jgi:hypothetical protein